MLLGYSLLVRPGLRKDDAKAGFRVFSDTMSASALDVNTLQLWSLLNPCLCCIWEYALCQLGFRITEET